MGANQERFKLARPEPCQGKVRKATPVAVTHPGLEKRPQENESFQGGELNGRDFLESIDLDYKNPKVSCSDRVKGRKMDQVSCNCHYPPRV